MGLFSKLFSPPPSQKDDEQSDQVMNALRRPHDEVTARYQAMKEAEEKAEAEASNAAARLELAPLPYIPPSIEELDSHESVDPGFYVPPIETRFSSSSNPQSAISDYENNIPPGATVDEQYTAHAIEAAPSSKLGTFAACKNLLEIMQRDLGSIAQKGSHTSEVDQAELQQLEEMSTDLRALGEIVAAVLAKYSSFDEPD